MKKFTQRLTIICLAVLMLAAALAGCGSKKEKNVDGYYVFAPTSVGSGTYALEIHGGTAIMHHSHAGSKTVEGNVEITDEGADLYFEASRELVLQTLSKYNPFHVRISNDGERMYFSSDSENWITDTYEVVSKKEFEEIINGF